MSPASFLLYFSLPQLSSPFLHHELLQQSPSGLSATQFCLSPTCLPNGCQRTLSRKASPIMEFPCLKCSICCLPLHPPPKKKTTQKNTHTEKPSLTGPCSLLWPCLSCSHPHRLHSSRPSPTALGGAGAFPILVGTAPFEWHSLLPLLPSSLSESC